MSLDLCYHKVCNKCGKEFTTDKSRKRQCQDCDAAYLVKEASQFKNPPMRDPDEGRIKTVPKLSRKEVALASMKEGLTYGQYLYKHGLYHDTVDTTVNTPKEALTYNQAKALADAEGLSYREYMARR